MPRRKKIEFQLDPEWMLKEPLDFEFNKYTLLDYIQKCEKRFEKKRDHVIFGDKRVLKQQSANKN